MHSDEIRKESEQTVKSKVDASFKEDSRNKGVKEKLY